MKEFPVTFNKFNINIYAERFWFNFGWYFGEEAKFFDFVFNDKELGTIFYIKGFGKLVLAWGKVA